MRTWELGEVFILRHAGFPFDWLEGLGFSAPFLAEVEALLDVEEALCAEAQALGGERAVKPVREALERGRVPRAPKPGARFEELLARWTALRGPLVEAHAAERKALQQRLHGHAAEPQVQEAVFLSSPAMFDNVWARYAASGGDASGSDARRVERQVYAYLQRLCAKNETTSFFGPMGYGALAGEDGLHVEEIPVAERRRRTFLSFWVVQELARTIARDRALRAHLPLRLNPLVAIDGGRAHSAPLGIDQPLGADELAVLALFHGAKPEVELTTATLAAALGTDVTTAERRLLPLFKAAVVVRGLRFERDTLEAFAALRSAVEALPEGEARTRWLGELTRLDALRADFERADLAGRQRALPALEAAFTALTGIPGRRGEGRMYVDRLVVYEEASSPFRLRFGAALAAQLEAAISPSLELSAAFGGQVQRSYGDAVKRALAGRSAVDFLTYATLLRPDQVEGSQFSPVAPLELAPSDAATLTISDDLAGPAAPGGRFCLPDVCLSAAPGETTPREILVARVHHHLLLWSWLCAFHPERAEVEAAARRWLETEPSAAPLASLALTRRNKGFYAYPGAEIAYTPSEAADLGPGDLSASTLQVALDGEAPRLTRADGSPVQLYLPLADFSTYPPFAALAHPLVLHAPVRSSGTHVPRLQVGGAVYQRERWEVTLGHLAPLTGLELLLAVRRVRRAHRWPRFLFGRVPAERKPFLLDTESPFALELLRHLVREAPHVTFEEMFPGPEGLWLRDARGRYTCELRMQATRYSDDAPRRAR